MPRKPGEARPDLAALPRERIRPGFGHAVEGGNAGDTTVVVEIFEGPKVKVGEINFAGNHFASAAQLKTRIGNPGQILDREGKYHSDLLDDDRQKLIDYYQSQGFFEVKVTPVTRPGAEQGRVDLTFAISEGTRLPRSQRDHRG